MGKNGESLSKEKRLTLCISQAMFDKLRAGKVRRYERERVRSQAH